MIVVDEYLAIRSLLGLLPDGLPDEPLAITTAAHWRLLQRVHAPSGGQLSQALAALPAPDREALRFPHREVLEVLDPRPRLDEAAQIAALYGNTGWLISETVTAGLNPWSPALVREPAQHRPPPPRDRRGPGRRHPRRSVKITRSCL